MFVELLGCLFFTSIFIPEFPPSGGSASNAIYLVGVYLRTTSLSCVGRLDLYQADTLNSFAVNPVYIQYLHRYSESNIKVHISNTDTTMFRSDSIMEQTLQEDLAQALDGLDPLAMLMQDPAMANVAEEVLLCQADDEITDNKRLDGSNGGSPEHQKSADPSPPYSPEMAKPWKTDKKRRRRLCKDGANVLCKVCDRPSEGHSYYGVVACNSCRSFFFRSIKNGDYHKFLCISIDDTQKCMIDSVSWRTCMKCRFEKCMQMGMRVPTESPMKSFEEEFMQNVIFVKHLRNSLALSNKLTIDEKTLLRDMTIKYFTTKVSQRIKFLTSRLDIYKEMLEQIYLGKIFTLEGFKSWEEYFVFRQMEAYSNGELSQDNMTKKDRARLLKTNCVLANEFSDAFLIHEIQSNEQDFTEYAHMIINGIWSMNKKNCNMIHEQVFNRGEICLSNIRLVTSVMSLQISFPQ